VRRGGVLLRRGRADLHDEACAEGATTRGVAATCSCAATAAVSVLPHRRVSAAAPPFVLQLHFAPEGAKEDDSEEQMPVRRSGRGGVEQLHRWWWWLPPLGTGGTARIVCRF